MPTPRLLDARPDTLDFRDRMFEPTLVEVPVEIPLKAYQEAGAPILDQGTEGACTGFGLAAVAHYLLRVRKQVPDPTEVSPRMFYEMARRYDEWPGEAYSGSSARGAMKGWHKHGVCAGKAWPYKTTRSDAGLTNARAKDAEDRPLGAYFRVNHHDLVALHTALAEVGILYATATVHQGWDAVKADGKIPFDDRPTGGHAFALVAFDRKGFWLQNSWGPRWGLGGFAHITYDDWLQNASDVWVARLGAPVTLARSRSVSIGQNLHSGNPDAYTSAELRPHIVLTGNDGALSPGGAYGTTPRDIDRLFAQSIPEITRAWPKKRLLLFAHGGLVPEKSAVQRLADLRGPLLENHVYPISFIWRSDFWTTLRFILEDALSQRRPEGLLDVAKDFMLDRLDDMLEPVARHLGGKLQWDEMKENALRSTTGCAGAEGGAALFLKHLGPFLKKFPEWEIHLVGHSAGSIYLGPLAQGIGTSGRITSGPLRGRTGLGKKIQSLNLWAPACTTAFFHQTYLPLLKARRIDRFGLFTLTDKAERDDHCAKIYNKSLLYLVSHAFEKEPRVPWDKERQGIPLLGLERALNNDPEIAKLWKRPGCDWILSPNEQAADSGNHATATSHGGFDNDPATLASTLIRILGKNHRQPEAFASLPTASLSERRLSLKSRTR
jgi:hypothetical protein